MLDFSARAGASLVLRTYPFMLLRIAVYFGIAAAFVVAAGAGSAFGWAIGALGGQPGRMPGAFWGAIGGLAVVALMLRWLREYLLYLVRTGHVAAMVLALGGGRPPAGLGQIGYAIGLVQQRFHGMDTLFAIERVVRGTLAAIVALADPAARLLPAGLGVPTGPVNSLLRIAFGSFTELVLAQPLRSGSNRPWPEARDALLQFAEHHEALFRNAMLIYGASFGAAFLAFLLALLPASALAAAYPGDTAPIGILLAAIFAWSFKQAVVEPFAVAAMLEVYLRVTQRAPPESDWDGRLTEASADFRELKARAAGARRGSRRPPAA